VNIWLACERPRGRSCSLTLLERNNLVGVILIVTIVFVAFATVNVEFVSRSTKHYVGRLGVLGMEMTSQKRMVSVRQAAEELGLSVACVRKWIAERRMEYVRLGRAIRVPGSEIDRLIAEGTIPAKGLR
jgi:excisionase family DNA binding protein